MPQCSEVLPYPSVHVVFEGADARIFGIVRKKFVRELKGAGEVFGIKFRPGMFRALCSVPSHRVTDLRSPIALVPCGEELAHKVRGCTGPSERAAECADALSAMVGKPDPKAVLARDLVERLRVQCDLHTVAALSSASGHTERVLQRVFREFVGASPKWVVRRFRLQEAAELVSTTNQSIATVAANLGYFDQAHFVRDFKSVVRLSPTSFLRQARVA